MPKPSLIEADAILERQIIETMIAGLQSWRPDLDFPQSNSDCAGCARALMSMFEIKRRPIAAPLRLLCNTCDGIGHLIAVLEGSNVRSLSTCKDCGGKGFKEGRA